ncbi:terminase large subunit [Bacillus phage 031MP004]|nr:terminase large subunit [Bacillus phage 022DV001]QFG05402.1 terminase large subunit [Bacillus phage 031MP003]QFG05493.1 terminase large subunit [Bacillus phage 031MP002]QFG05580.1 terminase large subunit [Bacillus phage 031MP004]QFG05755.1 terminase large subunit [Bacillus phage 055SW001]
MKTTAKKIDKSSPQWKAMKVKPFSPPQMRALALSTAPFNLWDGSIRSGKTFLSILWLIQTNQECPSGDGMILGQTPETIERNFLTTFMETLGESNYHYRQGKTLDVYYYVGNERKKRRYHIIGAKDKTAIGRIRGSTVMIGYVDEGSLIPQQVFDEFVGRLSSAHAKCLVTTNPDSPNHWLLKDYVENPEASKDWRRFRFLLEDNLSLDQEYIDRIKRQYRGIPARYQRMIKGKWVKAEGLIYQEFDEKRHVVDDPPQDARLKKLFIGSDYGVGNPTTFLLIGEYIHERKKKYYILKEYYYSGRETMVNKTTSQYAEDFVKFIKGHKAFEVVIDPSAAALITELELDKYKRAAGVFYDVVTANNSVLEGIQTVANMFADDALFVCRRCEHTIEELGLYSWDEKAQAQGEDKPVKEDDHCMDAMRYAILTIIGTYGEY